MVKTKMAHPGWQAVGQQAAKQGVTLAPATLAVGDPLAGVRLAVPPVVRVSGDRSGDLIVWGLARDGWQEGEPVRDCLMNFLRLADEEDPQRFADFAARYGVLGLDPTGEPGCAAGTMPERVGDATPALFGEPVRGWQWWATNARAFVALSVALRDDWRSDPAAPIDPAAVLVAAGIPVGATAPLTNVNREEEWSPPWRRYALELAPRRLVDNLAGRTLAGQRAWLAGRLGALWLDRAKLTPIMEWDGDGPRVTLGLNAAPAFPSAWPPACLFAVLAAQLAAAVADPMTLTCSRPGCGVPFRWAGKRAPRPDQPHYCGEDCRHDARKETKRTSARTARVKASPATPKRPVS